MHSIRTLNLLLALICLGVTTTLSANESRSDGWPDFDRFAERFIQADGRVIDLTFDGKTTSEGQSYGLFFALVANQRDRFDTLLKWTEDNLCDGDLNQKLPGWLWGKKEDGSWGIKDRNAASDADLWIAYSLLEAGRLWKEPRYEAQGRRLLSMIAKQEVVDTSSGKLLLPGPIGFELANRRYRINPSYLPAFMFVYFSKIDPAGPWAGIWQTYTKLAPQVYARGVAPDLVVVDHKGRVTADSERTPAGSYDAIRVYLWAGMSGRHDKESLNRLRPFAKMIREHDAPPEKVDPNSGAPTKTDFSPIGFSGAVLPFLSAIGDDELDDQLDRIKMDALQAKLGRTTHYYDQVLILFGKGWVDGYYKFDDEGRLVPKWK